MNNFVAMTRCFYCGEGNEILLHRRFGNLSEAHDKVHNMNPCPKCEEFMKQGIILIGIDEAKSAKGWNIPPDRGSEAARTNWMPNPHRTGQFVVIKEEALARIINSPELVAYFRKHRWMFIEGEALSRITPPQEVA